MECDNIRGPRFDRETVARLAEMTKLTLTPEEPEELSRGLCSLVDYIDSIADIDTDGAEPTARVSFGGTALRDDVPAPPRNDMLCGSASRDGAFVVLPGDIQGEGGV